MFLKIKLLKTMSSTSTLFDKNQRTTNWITWAGIMLLVFALIVLMLAIYLIYLTRAQGKHVINENRKVDRMIENMNEEFRRRDLTSNQEKRAMLAFYYEEYGRDEFMELVDY